MSATSYIEHKDLVGTVQRKAFLLFLLINVTALSLVMIVLWQALKFDLLQASSQVIGIAVLMTMFVAVPIAGLAAQHKIDIEKLKIALLELGPIDQLTGLLDRRFFKRVLEDELVRMETTSRPSAIALFEVDEFEAMKERYGKKFGNAVLRQVAIVAHAQMRGPFDKMSRWTNDRFIVMMHDVSIAEAENICDRLRKSVASKLIDYKGYSTRVTLSFGVSSFPPKSDIDDVLARATSGIEISQKYGGNKVINDTPYPVQTSSFTEIAARHQKKLSDNR